MQIKAKKRQIVKPLSDFIEPEDDQENDQEKRRVNEREKERERERERQENYKENGLLLVDEDLEGALLIWQRGVLSDPENYLVHDLISQALLNLDQLLPAIKAAEEVVRIAPGWADGYVTLARAQREFGEPELALENFKTARSIHLKRIAEKPTPADLFEECPTHLFDSTLDEIQSELVEIETVVIRLQEKRLEYSSQSIPPSEENGEIGEHQCDPRLQRCLQNLCGRVRVVKQVPELS